MEDPKAAHEVSCCNGCLVSSRWWRSFCVSDFAEYTAAKAFGAGKAAWQVAIIDERTTTLSTLLASALSTLLATGFCLGTSSKMSGALACSRLALQLMQPLPDASQGVLQAEV